VVGGEGDPMRLASFLTRIGRPQWTDPRLDWQGTPSAEGYPSRLLAPVPEQLVLWSGRFPAGADLDGVLRANGIAGTLETPLRPVAAPEGSGLATRWARLQVDDLLAAHDSGGNRDELHDAIVATALNHGLVTRFTSRVAVELAPSLDGAASTRDVASGLPLGSKLLGPLPAGGTLDRLWRILGFVFLLTGTAALMAGRRRYSR
jgi:Ca-activated chloride channel homolog